MQKLEEGASCCGLFLLGKFNLHPRKVFLKVDLFLRNWKTSTFCCGKPICLAYYWLQHRLIIFDIPVTPDHLSRALEGILPCHAPAPALLPSTWGVSLGQEALPAVVGWGQNPSGLPGAWQAPRPKVCVKGMLSGCLGGQRAVQARALLFLGFPSQWQPPFPYCQTEDGSVDQQLYRNLRTLQQGCTGARGTLSACRNSTAW